MKASASICSNRCLPVIWQGVRPVIFDTLSLLKQSTLATFRSSSKQIYSLSNQVSSERNWVDWNFEWIGTSSLPKTEWIGTNPLDVPIHSVPRKRGSRNCSSPLFYALRNWWGTFVPLLRVPLWEEPSSLKQSTYESHSPEELRKTPVPLFRVPLLRLPLLIEAIYSRVQILLVPLLLPRSLQHEVQKRTSQQKYTSSSRPHTLVA